MLLEARNGAVHLESLLDHRHLLLLRPRHRGPFVTRHCRPGYTRARCRTKTLSSDNSRKEGRACSSAFSPSSRPSSQPQRPGEPRSPHMLRPCSRSLQCSFQQSHVPARPPHRTISCAGRPCERCRPQIQLRPDVKLGRKGRAERRAQTFSRHYLGNYIFSQTHYQ